MSYMPAYISHKLRELKLNQRGVAAIEMAILAPIFITLIIGGIEMTRYVIFLQKVASANSVITDFVAQQPVACQSELMSVIANNTDLYLDHDGISSYGADGAPSPIILSLVHRGDPLGNNRPQSVCNGNTCYTWSRTGNVSQTPTILNTGLPGGMTIANGDNYIVVEMTLNYEPMLSATSNIIEPFAPGFFTQRQVSIFKPRNGDLKLVDLSC